MDKDAFPPSTLLLSFPPTQQGWSCSLAPLEILLTRVMPKREFYHHCVFECQVKGKIAEPTVYWRY